MFKLHAKSSFSKEGHFSRNSKTLLHMKSESVEVEVSFSWELLPWKSKLGSHSNCFQRSQSLLSKVCSSQLYTTQEGIFFGIEDCLLRNRVRCSGRLSFGKLMSASQEEAEVSFSWLLSNTVPNISAKFCIRKVNAKFRSSLRGILCQTYTKYCRFLVLFCAQDCQ